MGRYLLREVPRTLLRLAVAFGIFGIVSGLPLPDRAAHIAGIVALALLAASVVIICGSLLYNTLFYDHYWRKADSR